MLRSASTAVVSLVVLAALPLATRAAEPAAAPAAAAKGPVISCEGNEKNLKTYLQIHKVLFMERDSTRVGEFYAPEVISHNLDSGGSGARPVKNADMAAMWAASKKYDPKRVLADDLILCSGPYVIVRTTMHGSDNFGYDGNKPTGKPYSISATDIYRFENGKVVERWGNADLVSMFRQIGYTLTPPAAVAKPAATK
jgi:predicted ester cyclase